MAGNFAAMHHVAAMCDMSQESRPTKLLHAAAEGTWSSRARYTEQHLYMEGSGALFLLPLCIINFTIYSIVLIFCFLIEILVVVCLNRWLLSSDSIFLQFDYFLKLALQMGGSRVYPLQCSQM